MKCPSCQVDLVMSERSGIEIDYCPQCRGVWLDRGELDKIIERNSQAAPPPPAADTGFGNRDDYRMRKDERRYHDDDDYYKRKRKKNLLDDLFDF